MTLTIAIEELEINIAIQNHNHKILTLDFLKYSGIVPNTWELMRPPKLDTYISHIAFANGIDCIAQPDKITFSESLQHKTIKDLKIPAIACEYIKAMPNAYYQAIGISPRSFVTFENKDENTARNYIINNFLSPAAWYKFGKETVQASINLVYTLEECQLNLNIDEVILRLPNKIPQPAVLFSSNFIYEISGETSSERLQNMYQSIDNWQNDLKTYQEFVSQMFVV